VLPWYKWQINHNRNTRDFALRLRSERPRLIYLTRRTLHILLIDVPTYIYSKHLPGSVEIANQRTLRSSEAATSTHSPHFQSWTTYRLNGNRTIRSCSKTRQVPGQHLSLRHRFSRTYPAKHFSVSYISLPGDIHEKGWLDLLQRALIVILWRDHSCS